MPAQGVPVTFRVCVRSAQTGGRSAGGEEEVGKAEDGTYHRVQEPNEAHRCAQTSGAARAQLCVCIV